MSMTSCSEIPLVRSLSRSDLSLSAGRLVGQQEWHDDVGTFEDIKMQVALHDYDERQGPTRFLPTTHRPCEQLLPLKCDADFHRLVGALPWAVRTRAVRAGDVTLYFSRMLHAGGPRQAGSPARYVLDAALHSGRPAIESEKGEFVSDSLGASDRIKAAGAQASPAAEALDAFRRVWSQAAVERRVEHERLDERRRDEL